MLIGKYFKNKRLEMKLSEADIAKLIGPGFQDSLLWDFESGDDNDIDGWTIDIFKKYCEILKINPESFAEIPIIDIENLSFAKIIEARRVEKGLKIDDLAEAIGYEPIVIKDLEAEKFDQVSLDALKQISITLDIPLRVLLEKLKFEP